MFLGVVGDVDGEVTLACRKTCRKRDGVDDESIGGGVAVGGIHRLCVCLTGEGEVIELVCVYLHRLSIAVRDIPVVTVSHSFAFFVNNGEHVLLATLHLQRYGAESEAVGRGRVSPRLAVELIVVDVSVGYFGEGLEERLARSGVDVGGFVLRSVAVVGRTGYGIGRRVI